MSNEAITFVRKSNLKPSGLKFVAFCLADYADEAWSCYPSIAKICEFTGQGEKTVRDHLNTLEEIGFLTRNRKRREDGTLSGYRFKIVRDFVFESEPAANFARGENFHKPAANFAAQEPPLDPPITTLQGADAQDQYSDLSERLCQAAGIDDETKSPGLLALSEPLRWLEQGCDLEKDILPTIRAKCANGFRPGGWGYFTNPVFEARARRLTPAPKQQTKTQSANKPSRESYAERLARLEAAQ